MTTSVPAKPAKPLGTLPLRMHHHAYTTDDHEKTRHFYEDILGIPLTATYIEREMLNGEWIELAHTFYTMGDGSALAFFNFADERKQAEWKAKEQQLAVHISFLVEPATQDEILARIAQAGIESFKLEHGYCTSLYFQDPNGLRLEFTVDHPEMKAIAREMETTAHKDLRRWNAGDRVPNNRWRPALDLNQGK